MTWCNLRCPRTLRLQNGLVSPEWWNWKCVSLIQYLRKTNAFMFQMKIFISCLNNYDYKHSQAHGQNTIADMYSKVSYALMNLKAARVDNSPHYWSLCSLSPVMCVFGGKWHVSFNYTDFSLDSPFLSYCYSFNLCYDSDLNYFKTNKCVLVNGATRGQQVHFFPK